MLDTYYAEPDRATDSHLADGTVYRCMSYREFQRDDLFLWMSSVFRWLLLEDMVSVLRAAGFVNVEGIEMRSERNDPRALLFASR